MDTLSPFSEQLIKSLFGVLTKHGSEENSHTMKGNINYCNFCKIILLKIMLLIKQLSYN